MSSIDERIVEMKFDNSQFESGVSTTLKSLENLKNGLDLKKSAESVDGLTGSVKNLSSSGLQNIAAGVESLSKRFSAFGIVGMTVISNLTTSIMNAGKALYNNLISPIVSGGWNRASNIEQAKFQIEGLGKDWTALSKDITQAVDGTAYGFDEAAMAAGQLAASGVEAGDRMEHSLQGISGTAAMTGRSYTDIAQIFATVAGNGRLMSEQLLQFSASGINAAAVLANYLGQDEATVRDMVSKGKIDFQTFSDAMYSAFGEHAKDANKTFTGALSNVHAAMSKIGADFESVLISSDDQANGINNLIGILNAFRNVLNGVRTSLQQTALPDFTKTVHALCDVVVNFLNSMFEVVDKDGKQVTQLVEPLRTAFSNFYSAFKNVADFVISIASNVYQAWTQIFPPVTFDTIKNISAAVKDLTGNLKLNDDQASKVRDIASGIFSAMSLIGKVIGGLVSAIGKVASAATPLWSSLLDISASIGRYITGFNSAISSTNTFGDIVDSVASVVHTLAQAFRDLVDNIGPGFDKFISGAIDSFKHFASGAAHIDIFGNIAKAFSGFVDKIKSGLNWLKNNISLKDIFGAIMSIQGLQVMNSIVSVFYDIKSAIHTLFGGDTNEKGNQFGMMLNKVKNALTAFTKGVSVGSVLAIAVAVGILAASISVISKIKVPNLVASIGAIGAMLAMLCGAFKSLTKALSRFKSSGMVKTAALLIGVAIAINILASAVKKMADIDLFSLVKSIAALAAMMKILTSSVKKLDGTVSIKTSVALLAIAVAMKILAGALSKFAGMSWDEIARGIVAFAGALGIMVLGIKGITKSDISIGDSLAIIAVAGAAKQLAEALKLFAEMPWEEIGRGITGMGAALGELVTSLKVLNELDGKSSMANSASLVAIVISLKKLADNLKEFASLSWEEIARGLVGMGGALAELLVSLNILNRDKFDSKKGLVSAVTLVLMVQALKPLADALQQIGGLSWESIAKGLVGIGAALSELALVSGLLGKLDTDGSSLVGAVSILIMADTLLPIGNALQQIGSLSWDEIARGLVGMGGALAELAVVSGVLGDLSPLAMLGSGALLVGVQALSPLADALEKFGSMSWDEIGKGLAAMAGALGTTALGGLLNTFSGIGATNIAAMTGPLGDLADSMSKWKNVTLPDGLGNAMFEIAHGVMQFTLDGCGADTLATVAEPLGTLADSVQKWSYVSVPDGLGDQLTSLANGVGAFWASGWGADAISTVAGPLGTLADSVLKWTGVTVPEGLGDQVGSLAGGISAFWNSGWGADAISTVAAPLGTLADSVLKWSGVSIPEGMSDQLSSLASGVQSFSFAALGGWSISTICDPLSQFADAVAKWVGVSVPDGIGDQLTSLSNGIMSFSWAFMGGLSLGTVTGPLGDLADSIQKWSGVSIPDNLSDQLSGLSSGIQAFSWTFMGGWSLGAITGPLGDLASSIQKWSGVSVPDSIGDQLSSLASGVNAFSYVGDVSGTISTVSTSLSSLSTAVSQISFVDYAGAATNLTTFVDGVNSLQGINTGFADQLNAFATSISDAMTNLNTVISTESINLSTSFSTMSTSISLAIMGMGLVISLSMASMIGSISTSSASVSMIISTMSASISAGMVGMGISVSVGAGLVSSAIIGMSGAVVGSMLMISGVASSGAGSMSSAMYSMAGAALSASGTLGVAFGSMVSIVGSSLAICVGSIYGNIGTFAAGGAALGIGFAGGILGTIGTVISAGSQLGSSAAGGIGDHYNEFYSCGSNLAQGMADGISSGHDAVVNAAAALGRASVTAVNDATRVGSPSRLTYKTGMFFDLGLRNGIRNYAKLVKMEADDVATSAIDSTNGLADQVYEYASGDISPTITPVVDLTNVRKSFNAISSLIPNQTIGINTSSTANAIGNVIPASQQILAAQAAPSNTTISGDTYTVSLNGITYNDRNDMQDVTRNYIRELTKLAAM